MWNLKWNYEELYVEIIIHSKGFSVIDNDFWYNINVCSVILLLPLFTAYSDKAFHQIYLIVSCLFDYVQYVYDINKLYD